MQNDKNRIRTRIASYLVGIDNQRILLGKRINATHMNEHWSLPAGHVYEGESCTQAMIRESLEECGLDLTPNDLRLIGVMHHNSPPFDYINYIFSADLKNHQIINIEPEKCESLSYFAYDDLPTPMEDYIRFIIDKTLSNKHPWLVEYGF
ncbi:MAG: NUDIX domain-containing protein [Myxococcaceae bacterium]